MPLDETTGKVSYAGRIEVPGYDQTEILDKLHIWLSYFHQFRGSFGPVHEIPGQAFLHTSIQLNITPTARSRIWWVNASLKADAEDGYLDFVITDFYTFTSTLVLPQTSTPYESTLEENEYFDIYDLDRMNDNARTLDDQVQQLIGSLRDFIAGR